MHPRFSRSSPGAAGAGEAQKPNRWFKYQEIINEHNVPSTYSCCYVNGKEQPGQHQNRKHPLQSKWKGGSEMLVKNGIKWMNGDTEIELSLRDLKPPSASISCFRARGAARPWWCWSCPAQQGGAAGPPCHTHVPLVGCCSDSRGSS